MLDDLMNDYQEFIDEKLNDTNTILDEIKTLLGSDIIETIKGLDSNLTMIQKIKLVLVPRMVAMVVKPQKITFIIL